MRLSTIFLMLLLFTTYAHSSGQNQTVTLKLEKASLYQLFDQIRQQTGIRFLFNADQLQGIPEIRLDVKNEKVSNILTNVLSGTPLTFRFENDMVMLVKKDQQQQQPKITYRRIVGYVTDEKKHPLPGASVVAKGKSAGTSTNRDGYYSLTVFAPDNFSLLYSFVGKELVEVKYAGKDTINVVLEDEAQMMDEVVVSTGYQNVNRRDMVGSYKTKKAEELTLPTTTSIDQALQGQIAGMIVTSPSTRAGSSPKIQIRGASTLLGNTSPLWVVDGIIQPDPIKFDASSLMTGNLEDIIGSQISWLNPQDIETITVLKDASATAIYGSKASNGVIVVTTKKGYAGRLTVNYTGNFSLTGRPSYSQFNLMNSQERIQFSEEAIEWGAFYSHVPPKQMNIYEGAYRMYLEGDITAAKFLEQKQKLESVNTDWLKLLTRNAFSHNHSLSLSGGQEKLTYNVSLGYMKENGQETGNSNERFTGRMALNATLRRNIRVNTTVNVTSARTDGFGPGVSPLSYALNTSRAIPAYDDNGDLLLYRKRTSYRYNKNVNSLGYNIINERDNSGAIVRNFVLASSLDFKWDLTDWLSYQFTGGYNRTVKNSENYAGERTFYIAQQYRGYDYGTVSYSQPEYYAAMFNTGGTLYTNDLTQSAYNIQNKLLISKTFNPKHRLNAMLGLEIRSSHNMKMENTVWGYQPNKGHKLSYPNIGSQIIPIGSPSAPALGVLDELYKNSKPAWSKGDETDNYLSWFGTVAYVLKSRYVFNVNIRNDQSNRFGQYTKSIDPNYSFGVSWRATEEPFMQKVPQIGNLTLRATYGIQGNALSGKSPELILQIKGMEPVYQQPYSDIYSIPNPYLTWEKTSSWNFGIDLELFNFFNVTAEYYHRRSNAVINQAIPYEYGKTTMDLNGGIIYNKGMEFTVAFTPIRRDDFALSISLNSSKNWNKAGKAVVRAKSSEIINPSTEKVYREGYPVGSFWSYSFAGLDPQDGHPLFNYIDVPEDQRDGNADPLTFMTYSGQKDPYFTGGLNLGIRYKSFTLNTDFTLLLGGKQRLPSPYQGFVGGNQPDPENNLSRDLLKRWKQSGDEAHTIYPGLVRGNGEYKVTLPDKSTPSWFELWRYSDAMVVSSSFLRCRQIGLTYRMSQRLCDHLKIKTLTLNGVVSNVFVVASKRFNGMDPELTNSVMPRAFSFGVSVGF